MELIDINLEEQHKSYLYDILYATLLNTHNLLILRNYISENREIDASYQEYYDKILNQNYKFINEVFRMYYKMWAEKEEKYRNYKKKNISSKKMMIALKMLNATYKDLIIYLKTNGELGRNILESLKLLDQIEICLNDCNNENCFNLERSRNYGRS